MRIIIISFFAFFFLFPNQNSAQNLYDRHNSIRFANYLTASKQYDLAAQEYERILFMDPENDSIKFLLINTYRIAGNFTKGIERAQKISNNIYSLNPKLGLEYLKMLVQNGSYDKIKDYLEKNQRLSSNDKLLIELNLALFNYDRTKAQTLLLQCDTVRSSLLIEYKDLLREKINLRYKSPIIALSLSAIIPGSGKLYTRDWKDGIIGLLTIGASTWQAYTGFKSKGVKSTYGWIYAGLGIGFYSGNLYGSYKSAKRYNVRLVEKIHKKVEALNYRIF